jgi:uncharacterized Zn-binding protein involved in type VI secretion
MPEAARLGDPIGHSPTMSWLLKGLLIGAGIALVGVAIVGTGGLAAVAIVGGAAAAGAGIGEVMSTMSFAPKEVVGQIIEGSRNVYIRGKKAARAHVDHAECGKHPNPPKRIATGSGNVYINGMPAARVGDKTECGAEITAGAGNVFIGGGTQQTDAISPENLVPGWVHAALLVVGLGAAVVLAGPIIAVTGFVGGVAGGVGGSWLGGKLFGEGSDGQKWMMLGGSFVGGMFGAKGGQALQSRLGNSAFTRNVHEEALARINGQSASQRGPVLSGVRDTQTGEIHYGKNFDLSSAKGRAEYAEFREQAHPVTNARIEARESVLRSGEAVAGPRDGTPGAHSEVVALDRAIQAREQATGIPVTEADLPTFQLHNQSLMNAHPATPMHRCSNCTSITDGVEVIGHD